eukprot:IDg10987t1
MSSNVVGDGGIALCACIEEETTEPMRKEEDSQSCQEHELGLSQRPTYASIPLSRYQTRQKRIEEITDVPDMGTLCSLPPNRSEIGIPEESIVLWLPNAPSD